MFSLISPNAPDLAPAEDEEWVTVREVARQLRVNDATVRRWAKSGLLEAIQLPRGGKKTFYRIRRAALLRLCNGAQA